MDVNKDSLIIHDVILKFIHGVGIENSDIVDLETAKYLKKCGFTKPSHWYWQDKSLSFVESGLKRVKYDKRRMNHNRYDSFIYSAPTYSEVKQWMKTL